MRRGVRLAPGECIAERFVVESFASSGGMGSIYRAQDVITGRTVAIKVMAADHFADPNRFLRESVVLAGLSHPAIVHYLAHGSTPSGSLFLAMEWLEGEDLATRLVRQSLTVGECLTVLRRASEGLAAAHARGVVHRDVKPSNLFLVQGEPSRLKVLDFGIARDGVEGTLTQPGTLLGTVGYMSPEQAMGPREVDARADIFALGCVFFECLAGRPAFPGPNGVAVLAKVLREEAPRASQFRAEVDEELDALTLRMLSKKREGRPADAAALLLELDALRIRPCAGLERPSIVAAVGAVERKILSVILGEPRHEAEPVDANVLGGPVPERKQYQFRHAFLREAAYAMLTESDRVAAHALAGDWLERAGENDALVHVQLRSANPAKALELAEAGLDEASGGTVQSTWAALELGRARALWELGRKDEARAVITGARDRILRVAATIGDPRLRETFLTRPTMNTSTLALASEWLGAQSS